MCGITGAVGDLDPETLRRMVGAIEHRGPDNTATETIGRIHLGHTRLSIIDLSPDSDQPLWDSNKQACIVFNGEIYNYQSLRDELEAGGTRFHSLGDAEVLLNLYLRDGTAMFERINGIFAFAIWDSRSSELLLGRDKFGVKPLYYSDGETFLFASEIKSLLHAGIDRSLDYDALLRTLVFLWSPGEATILEQVRKLPPAHYMSVGEDGTATAPQRYWQWPTHEPIDGTETSHKLLDTLRTSVKDQMVADVPVGSFLSGGLDSSLIVALAKSDDTDVDCFTIDTTGSRLKEEGFIDDLPYARQVADFLGMNLNVVEAQPDILKLLPEMVFHLDELQADPAPINVFMICELARRKGIKVLLSGAGGDDLFTGYRRHFAVTLERYWTWLPEGVRRLLKRLTSRLPRHSSIARRIAKAFAYADLDGDERLLSYFYWMDPEEARALFTEKPRRLLNRKPMSPLLDALAEREETNPVERMLHLERSFFLVDHNLAYTDKMAMAHGVEVRVPFLDDRVACAAAEIPTALKQRGKEGKWILKKAAELVLPHHVIYRPKSGFGAPLRTWLNDELAGLVDSLLSDENIVRRGVFIPKAVRRLIEDTRSGKGDYSYPVFALVCFELWCRTFLDSTEPAKADLEWARSK